MNKSVVVELANRINEMYHIKFLYSIYLCNLFTSSGCLALPNQVAFQYLNTSACCL